ncbi:hypothetical protein [Shewanella surugensis]|uniref:Uncharacterized protein n=1 Tax=Shewanella surugensis TaxID=212020 RepID=A0ABT0LGX4_9GAMM|nr:hypothetical protein [Shewanella surugensis]MCL1126705.1 hypothetical protein [Shewanella surugensis]
MLIDWPVKTFGLPQLNSYTLKRQPNILRTPMASGHARQRRINNSVPTKMTAQWLLNLDKRNDFIGFIDYALSGGNTWFNLPIKVGDQLIDHECRFTTHPADDETPTLNHIIFKSVIEIRKAYRSPDEAIVTSILSPMTIDDFVAGASMSLYYKEN